MIEIENIIVTPEILSIISRIENFRGAWPFMSKNKDSLLTILKAQARISSTGASGRIEGSLLKDYEVEKVLGGLVSPLYRDRDTREARGYANVLERINEDYEILQITESLIKEFHSILIPDIKREGYRKTDKPEQNILIDEPTIDNAPPSEAPKLLEALIDKINILLKGNVYHPLLIAAVFVENFLSIDPFGEGNGRLSRLFATLILLKCGYDFISYYPFETIVEETRNSYLLSLKKSQIQNDPNPWIIYFLKTIEKTTIRLDNKISKDATIQIEDRYINLSPIERDIIKCVKEKESLYTTELVALLSNYKTPTLKKALRSLVEKNELIMLGTGRGTYYKDAKESV